MWTPVALSPAIIARLIMRAAGCASREAAIRSPRSRCVPNASPSRTATSGVTSTLTMPSTPSPVNSVETPRDSQIRFWWTWAPASIVLNG